MLEFPNLSNAIKLMRFIGEDCYDTKRLPGLSNLEESRHLELSGVSVTDIHGLDSLKKLETLRIIYCFTLKAISNLAKMGSTLWILNLTRCKVLEFVPSLGKFSCLEDLDFSDCKEVQRIHGVEKL